MMKKPEGSPHMKDNSKKSYDKRRVCKKAAPKRILGSKPTWIYGDVRLEIPERFLIGKYYSLCLSSPRAEGRV